MAELLLTWVNNEVRLSTQVGNFEEDFSTGYLFGELLNKYGLQDDFGEFSRKTSPQSRINNFTRLVPTLRSLGVQYDSKLANQIMTEQKGVSIRLLYAIKIALETGAKTQTMDMSMTVTKGGAPSMASMKSTRLGRDKRDRKDEEIFNADIRRKSQNPKELDMLLHLKPFHDRMIRNQIEAEDADAVDAAREIELRDQRREERISKMHESKAFMDEWLQTGKDLHARNLAIKKEFEKADLRFEISVAEKKKKQQENRDQLATNEMLSGIDDFEKNLTRVVGVAKGNADPSGEELLSQSLKTDNPLEHLHALKQRLPDPSTLHESAKEYVGRIREKRSEEIEARKERERRRRKVMLDQQRAQQETLDKRNEELLLKKLMKQSQEERRIAQTLYAKRQEKENIKQNRLFREEQYAVRRQKDYEEALARDAELGRKQREEYEEQRQEVKALFNRNEESRVQKRYEKHYALCNGIADQILELTYKVCDYREQSDSLVPTRTMREWVTLFIENREFQVDVQAEDSVKSVHEVEEDPEAAEELDEGAFNDYINVKGEWANSAFGPEPMNETLGDMLADLAEITAPPPPPPPPPLPAFPIKAAFVGRPFAGKSELAQQLENRYRVKVLNVESLVEEGIAAFRNGETEMVMPKPDTPAALSEKNGSAAGSDVPTPEVQPIEDTSERAKLGQLAEAAQNAGEEVSNDILVGLICDAIRRLPKESDLPEERIGWVLDGFPRTREQAAMLEYRLTGFEDPGPDDPKKKNKKDPKKDKKLVKVPAGEPEAPTATGLDVVVKFDIDTDLTMKRALGRLLDPKTQAVYHVEFNPPPEDELMNERLVPLEDPAITQAQVVPRCESFDENQPGVEDFYSKLFDNLQTYDASVSLEDMFNIVHDHLSGIADRKEEEARLAEEERIRKEEEAAAAAAAEEEERRLREEEEERLRKEEEERLRKEEEEAAAKGKKGKAPPKAAAPPPEEEEEEVPEEPDPETTIGMDVELADILLRRYDTTEEHYTDIVKYMMRSLRQKSKTQDVHLANLCREFVEFLRRPDEKQELVDQFQLDFNSIEQDMRYDSETKEELHQRADDLKEKLWDISDRRKEEAETERSEIMADSWVSDQIFLVANQFVGLMQAETDRYVATRRIIADYFLAKDKQILEDANMGEKDVEITYLELPNIDADATTLGGKSVAGKGKDPKAAKGKDAGKPPSRPPSDLGLDSEAPGFESIEAVVSHFRSLKETILSQVPPPKVAVGALEDDGGKGGKAAPKKGKGAEEEMVAYSNETMDDALQKEFENLSARVERVRKQAISRVKEIAARTGTTFRRMEDWLGIRFRSEMESTAGLMAHIQDAIEAEETLPYHLKLQGVEINIDEGALLADIEEAPPLPGPTEEESASTFTCEQLANVGSQLQMAGPSGLLLIDDFVNLMARLASNMYGDVYFPQCWASFGRKQFEAIAQLYDSSRCGFLDWRRFFLSITVQPPLASLNELKHMKELYQYVDSNEDGKVNLSEFLQVPFWYEEEKPYNFDDDNAQPPPPPDFDRDNALKEVLFQVFSDADNQDLLDYEKFLLTLCSDPEAVVGVEKAFHISSGGKKSGEGKVTQEELHNIFHHTASWKPEAENSMDGDPASMERIDDIYAELGIQSSEAIDYNQLAQSKNGSALLRSCTHYRYLSFEVLNMTAQPPQEAEEGEAQEAAAEE